MRHTGLAACLLCLGISACSADKPAAPTPVYPSVAGTYTGTATFLTTAGNVTCAANTAVSQAGRSVNLAAIQLGSECGVGTIPGGQFTISTTGALDIASTTFFDPGCDGTYSIAGSGGFFDREFRLTLTYTSSAPRCILRSFTTTMTR